MASPLLSIIALLFFLIPIGYALFLHDKNRMLKTVITDLQVELSDTKEQIENLKRVLEDTNKFEDKLDAVSITTRLQTTRRDSYQAKGANSPEKYQYIASLSHQGMGVDEITKILGLGRQEVEQLLRLAEIGNSNRLKA